MSITVEDMIEQYGTEILRLCLMILGDRQLAEDACQETLMKAWKGQHTFRGDSSMKTWLMRIATNTCRDVLRSGWLRMMRRSEPIEQLFDLEAPEQPAHTEVRDAVLHLPGKYREVVVLYYDQEMTLQEIADALRMPIHTVSTRLRRARILLRKELGEEVEA